MFLIKTFNRLRPRKQHLYFLQSSLNQRLKSNKTEEESKQDEQITSNTNSLGQMGTKYQVFRDQDQEVILDIYEERNKYASLLEPEEDEIDPLEGINQERGTYGVYDIENLIEVLRRENSEDIFVVSVPTEIKYVDYICIVTGKSHKHMQAIAQFVRKVYKRKMYKTDHIPRLEGEASKDWMALDLGNIALHIFSREARVLYDLDSLWALGSQHDPEYNKKDPVAEMLEKHSLYLKDLEPAR